MCIINIYRKLGQVTKMFILYMTFDLFCAIATLNHCITPSYSEINCNNTAHTIYIRISHWQEGVVF